MLNIRQTVVDAVVAHARRNAPNEACGYLGMQNDVIVKFFPMANADASPEHFSFYPGEQFAVVKAIRNEGLSAAAVVHSHPATPARMSEEDIRLARDPNIRYVIVSLAQSEPIVKAFKVTDSIVTPEEIEVMK